MNTKQRVSAQRGRASCRFGCQRVGCDRISLPRTPQGRKIATNNFGIREMSAQTTNLAAVATILALAAAANVASAAEKLVATDASVRTILQFRVPDAAAQKLLPEGWQVSPPSTGPSKDANLTVIFIDELAVQNPDGTPGELFRIAGIGVPAKKKGADATVGMVGPGLV